MLSFFLSSFIIILAATPVFSQDSDIKTARQTSIYAFSQGHYEKAYSGFNELLATYPKDPLYKYYSGVCLVKLNRDPERAENLLSDARIGSGVARIVPADAIYWQGRAMQMTGKYMEAVECYNTFMQLSSRKAARELNVSDYIEQCNRKEGELLSSASVSPDKVIVTNPEPEIPAEKPVDSLGTLELTAGNNVTPKNSLPAGYDILLSDAMTFHIKADSLYRIADSLKKSIENLSYREKSELKSKIDFLENSAMALQMNADKKYAEAQASMNVTPFVPELPVVKETPVEKDSFPAKLKLAVPVKLEPEKAPAVRKDNKIVMQSAGQNIFSFFKVLSKPDKNGDKIKVDAEVPPGLIYRIQLAVFTNPVTASYFKGITPVYGFRVAGTNKTNYYAGMFRSKADAIKALSVVRQKGFRDAFIVSFLDSKPVSSERAVILEKEWGKKPLQVIAQARVETQADTLPPTLSFRIEIMRSPKPVKEDVMEAMKKLTGGRGLDCLTLTDGTIVYLAGYFITYDSAEEYAGLLEKNGYRDAKVTAWLGKKEIPVETARQLFENLE
jgi:tetratricopeptide (TPR) repeat protein